MPTMYGVCDMHGVWSVGIGLLQVVPLFASWSSILLPEILMHALTFCIVMLCLMHKIWWTMVSYNM